MRWPPSLQTFSLRTLIVFTTLCGVGLAIYVSPWAEHRRQLQRLELAKEMASRRFEHVKLYSQSNGSVELSLKHLSNFPRQPGLHSGRLSAELMEAIKAARLIQTVFVWGGDADDWHLWDREFQFDESTFTFKRMPTSLD